MLIIFYIYYIMSNNEYYVNDTSQDELMDDENLVSEILKKYQTQDEIKSEEPQRRKYKKRKTSPDKRSIVSKLNVKKAQLKKQEINKEQKKKKALQSVYNEVMGTESISVDNDVINRIDLLEKAFLKIGLSQMKNKQPKTEEVKREPEKEVRKDSDYDVKKRVNEVFKSSILNF